MAVTHMILPITVEFYMIISGSPIREYAGSASENL